LTTAPPITTPENEPESRRTRRFPRPATTPTAKKRSSSALSIVVTALVVPGLFATVALPAYAYAPAAGDDPATASLTLEEEKAADAQTVFVAADAADSTTVVRDAFSATTEAELQRARLAAAYSAFSGPTVRDLLANPPYPSFSLDQVVSVGLQYQGVPYRYGGADPSGFDCSGFVSYVYAQFGIALPHSVSGTAAAGTPIAREAALPGDIVIIPGHNGIYMGNGMMLDAPRAGGTVQVRAIWTDDYYIVRIGI